MLLKTKIMKYINNQLVLAVLFTVSTIGFTNAQEIIKDSVKTQKPVYAGKKQKVDGIVATVGDYLILDSDIDKSYLELASQGNSVKDITRCQMLNSLLEDKLFAHQAVQDSIVVKDEEVKEKSSNE